MNSDFSDGKRKSKKLWFIWTEIKLSVKVLLIDLQFFLFYMKLINQNCIDLSDLINYTFLNNSIKLNVVNSKIKKNTLCLHLICIYLI